MYVNQKLQAKSKFVCPMTNAPKRRNYSFANMWLLTCTVHSCFSTQQLLLNLKAAELQILLSRAMVSRLIKQDSYKSLVQTLQDGSQRSQFAFMVLVPIKSYRTFCIDIQIVMTQFLPKEIAFATSYFIFRRFSHTILRYYTA